MSNLAPGNVALGRHHALAKVLKFCLVALACFGAVSCKTTPDRSGAGWRPVGEKTLREQADAFRALDLSFACLRVASPERIGWIEEEARLYSVDLHPLDRRRFTVVGLREPGLAVDRISWHRGRAFIMHGDSPADTLPAAADCRARDPVGEEIRRDLRRMKENPRSRRTIVADGLSLDVTLVENRGERRRWFLIHEAFERVYEGRSERLTVAVVSYGGWLENDDLSKSNFLDVVEKVRLRLGNLSR